MKPDKFEVDELDRKMLKFAKPVGVLHDVG